MTRSPLGQLARGSVRAGGLALNSFLHGVECGLLGRGDGPLRHPPIFILGAPRCGSTLLYQAMIDYFDVGYLSNLHCKFFGAPSLVERSLRPGGWRAPSSFRSEHGYVTGWSSPSECGDYWYRFFRRRPQYVPLSECGERSLVDLRRSFRAVGAAMGRSVAFKNLVCSLRLEPIQGALPESAYIVVQRSWLDTAHSILESRMKVNGNYLDWFSVEPPEVASLMRRPAYEQVVGQIRGVHGLIEEARSRSPDRFTDVDYEEFCRDTHAVLKELGGFLSGAGIAVRRAGDVPGSFPVGRDVRIDADLYERLRDHLRSIGRGGEDQA